MNSPRAVVLLTVMVYVAAAANASICSRVAIWGAPPDLLAVLAIIWMTLSGGQNSLVAVAALGLSHDLISGQRLGAGAACYLLAAFALESWQLRLAYRHTSLQKGAALVVLAGLELALTGIEWLESGMGPALADALQHGLVAGVYSALVAGLALGLLHTLPSQCRFS
ncbi:MAG: rod shape-determining protein MreD [Caldilineales bacterium]|jgi:rod shape-determining protein MreD|nr:rod shape-determining protein MreD [Caldilineales bacterium]